MIERVIKKLTINYNTIVLLLTFFIFSNSFAQSDYIPPDNSNINKYQSNPITPDSNSISSDKVDETKSFGQLEHTIAREMVNIGQSLEGNPEIEDVISVLTARSKSFLSGMTDNSSNWMYDKIISSLPKFKSKMVTAAIAASSTTMLRGGSDVAKDFASSAVSSSNKNGYYDLSSNLKKVYLVSSLEGIKAAAGASTLDILNRLELEYNVNDSGIEEYSALTMQPIWDSKDLRHNIFAQASYSNKEAHDIFADPSDYRHTGNAGLAYRYITPNERHMFGVNAFFDHQWPYHHNRISFGLDYKNTLVGASVNKYIGISGWRKRGDGFEEIVLDGEDIELSGRLPQLPELELFAKGYHWNQGITQVLNPDGSDIYGYQLATEYTPINGFTIRSSIRDDNATEDAEAQITFRFNYIFGKGTKYLFERPKYNLNSVVERRFDKVRRNNDIRVQVRQELGITAIVTYEQGANVSLGQRIAIGTTITTNGSTGDAVTVEFGNGARLDVGQNTQVRIESDRLVLITGIIQFTSGNGGITTISVPNGTINLIGTDVDVRVSGTSNTLRVRDGSADFTDDTGTTRINAEELAEAISGDGVSPQKKAEGSSIYDTHETDAHAQLNIVGPSANSSNAASYITSAISVNGSIAKGNVLTFTAPLSQSVTITGSPQLKFTLNNSDRLADYSSGSGTDNITFTYTVLSTDQGLTNINVDSIQKNGGTLTSSNGAALVRKISGIKTAEITGMLGQTKCPDGDLSAPANSACARLFGSDPTNIDDVMIYAGDVPGTTTDFFVRRCDLSQDYDPTDDRCEDGSGDPNGRTLMQWKDANTDSAGAFVSIGDPWTTTKAVDGPGNTALLVADGSGTHPAAENCNSLPGGGWYLPALSEVDVIYANLVGTDDPDHPLPTLGNAIDSANAGTTGPLRSSFETAGEKYWSSSERSGSQAKSERFSDGNQPAGLDKISTRVVRCARR